MLTARELLEQLNSLDECSYIEAKQATQIDKSIMESVCAFANEPNLGGGYLLLGIKRVEEGVIFPYYEPVGLENLDKIQSDFASQCATIFNQPLRPLVKSDTLNGKAVIVIYIAESSHKPVFFNRQNLPGGAFRRIAGTDQRCTEDDLLIFYQNGPSYDSTIIDDAMEDDFDPDAINHYRRLRANVNPVAEELSYSDFELLQSLGCMKKSKNEWKPTVAGIMLFGSRASQRRLLPMTRVDYIRVPGNEWVSNPDQRFTTIDMRGPLLQLVQRAFNAIADDMPKGFLLPEGELQAKSLGLPTRVLREALVNALMHRSYREHRPVQIIRYNNRIEIENAGFSLKSEDSLGEAGSENRNPVLAAVFHETNLAETKGSGIRTMRQLMNQATMVPPTFESSRERNKFTVRLLLHHFLTEKDLVWLEQFALDDLNDNKRRGLVFVREAGAIDNSTYRQLNNIDTFAASRELRVMRDSDLLIQHDKGRFTYYVPGPRCTPLSETPPQTTPPQTTPPQTTPPQTTPPQTTPPQTTPPQTTPPQTTPPQTTPPSLETSLVDQIPNELRIRIEELGGKTNDTQKMKSLILDLCKWRPLKVTDLSIILDREAKYLFKMYVNPMRQEGNLEYTIPETPNHQDQAYRATLP